jgi:hypothetical protein
MKNYLILKILEYKPFLDSLKGVFEYLENPEKDIKIKNIIDDSLDKTSSELVNNYQKNSCLKFPVTNKRDINKSELLEITEVETLYHIWLDLVKNKKIFFRNNIQVLSIERFNLTEIKLICEHYYIIANLRKQQVENYIK